VAAGARPAGDAQIMERLRRMPELRKSIHPRARDHFAWRTGGSWPWSTRKRLRRILTKMLDENEFPEPYGHPFRSPGSMSSTRTSST